MPRLTMGMELWERAKLRSRLMADGRWMEFDGYRRRYKKGGLPMGVAWQAAAAEVYPGEFPMPERSVPKKLKDTCSDNGLGELGPQDVGGVDGGMAGHLGPREMLKVEDMEKMYLWVFSNLGGKALRSSDAPHPAWWDLLQFYRQPKNKRSFYREILPKLIVAKRKVETDFKRGDDGRKLDGAIERVRVARENALLRTGAEGV